MRSARRIIRNVLHDDRGQNVAEYALIVMGVVLMAYMVMDGFMGSLVNYHSDVTRVLCLPLP